MNQAASVEGELLLSRRDKVFTLVGTLLGLLLAALDQTIVATAGPAIQQDLHILPSVYPWITTAYLVASTVMVPVWGKLSDLYGRKPILLAGIGLFLLGSLACGVSRSTYALIFSRAIQGWGSGALFTSAFAVAADIFSPAERGKYQGIFGACFALSSVVGPLIGGFLTDQWSWHWVFFVNLPLGAIALTFIITRMPMLKRERSTPPRIDFAGAFWLFFSVVPFLVALSLGRGGGVQVAWIAALIVVSVASLGAFLATERRAPEPLLDLRLFQNRVFLTGNLSIFILAGSFLGAIVFLPLYMVNVVGLSATDAGLTLTPLTFGIVAGNVLSGQLAARLRRYKPLMIGGNVILLCGFSLLGFSLRADSTQSEVTWKMVVMGLGLGPTIPLYVLAIQNAVSPKEIGVATASGTFFRQIGATMGVTLLGVVFALTFAAHTAEISRPAILEPLHPELEQNSASAALGDARLHIDVPAYQRSAAHHYASEPELQAQAMQAVTELDSQTKTALTQSISSLYRWCIGIALLGFVSCLFIPDRRLRGAGQRERA